MIRPKVESSLGFNYCFIIPCYEKHALKLELLISKIQKYQVEILVIDDGSSGKYARKIKSICDKHGLTLILNNENQGKGAALKKGLSYAHRHGYTHGFQIDSDGQHDINFVDKMMKLSAKHPHDLISAHPIYDESVPIGRLIGRYFTHIWVWIETLSFNLVDSMCGFRSYPSEQTIKILDQYSIGDRMDFDTDIMVKLYWEKTKVKFFPIDVKYFEDGESYFHYLNDNVLITKMHIKLFFGMLKRIPALLKFNYDQKNWIKEGEKGNVSLIKFSLLIYDLFGDKVLRLIVPFISFYYWIFFPKARKSSEQYQEIYKN